MELHASFLIRVPEPPWVISPAVACLSGLKSAPRKRVRGNPPRVQIPPPPPADKAKRWPATRWAPAFEVLVSSLVSSGYISIVSFAVWAGPEQHVEPIRHVAVNRSNDVCVAAYHRGR
jgi:hypothetical protein